MFLSFFHELSHSNLHLWTCSFMFLSYFHALPIQTSISEHVPSCSYHFSMSFPIQTSIYEHVPSCSYHFSMGFPIQTSIYEHVPSCSYHVPMNIPFKPPFMNMFLHVPIIFPWVSHSNLHLWTCSFMFLSYFHALPIQTSISEHVPSCSYHFSMGFPIQTSIYEHVPSCSYHISMSFQFKPPFMNSFLPVPLIFLFKICIAGIPGQTSARRLGCRCWHPADWWPTSARCCNRWTKSPCQTRPQPDMFLWVLFNGLVLRFIYTDIYSSQTHRYIYIYIHIYIYIYIYIYTHFIS